MTMMQSKATNYLINDDCLLGLKKLPENFIDLVLTDPPYNLGGHMKSRGSGVHRLRSNHFSTCDWDNLDERHWEQNMLLLATELARVVKDGGAVLMFMSVLKVGVIKSIFEEAGFYYKTTGTWHKTNPMPRNMNLSFVNSTESWIYFTKGRISGTFNNNGALFHDFVESGLTPGNEKKYGKHPTQKPLKILRTFISLLSNEKELVLDPFCGSGSTLVAAKELNRNFIGIEIDEEYSLIARQRIKENENAKSN